MERARKRELRDLNAAVWAGETDVFEVSKSLDSSLKKNTAFIKRLRTGITASAIPTFITDVRSLSLHKYLSEIISAFYEGLCKLKTPGEIAAGVEIASAIHQRFGPDEFTKRLAWNLGRGLTSPDKAQLKAWTQEVREREEKERLSRHRVLLRVVTEFWLVGLLRSLDDVERPDDSTGKGKDAVPSISGKGPDGSAKPRQPQSSAKPNQDKDEEPFPLEVLKDLLGYDKEHVNLPLALLFARTYSWDILGVKALEEDTPKEGHGTASGDEAPANTSQVDDPPLVSEKLQTHGKKKKTDGDDQSKSKADNEGQNGIASGPEGASKTDSQPADSNSREPEEPATTIANKSVGAQVDALLSKLPELANKDAVDQLALDFCFLNSKASRNRLVKAVQEVPKGRSDLLPLYARLVATLGQYLPDVPQGLIAYLDDEFRSLQRRKQKEFLGQVRTSNIRYLAELTKFGVVPEHVIFHCFKVSLDEFSRMNIEIIGNLLENCGRYLLRNPETAPRMASFLETLGRKKSAQHLGQQERMIIENAMYYVDPPPRPAIQQKERTPMELYIRKLVYLDMNKRNYTKVLKSIRKLHWEEPEVVRILEGIFSKPGKIKYGNIHLLAIIISALYRYHQPFVISVIDNVLERITIGLENNDFKFNQSRISEVKYLGELYNYKMVDSPVIFDTLYRIVTYGHGFKYYLHTKDPIPMDVDFVIQDTFALTRPQWKFAADFTEATKLFAEAVAQNYQVHETDKAPDPEEEAESSSSDDDIEDDGAPDVEEESTDEAEITANEPDDEDESESEEEQIFVSRQEEERDPEAEAEFDRAFEKMVSESVESRKFERKTMFDVPLPMRRANPRDTALAEEPKEPAMIPSNTMPFSLMTKRGNRQQTRTIDLPSDSSFAVAMKSQQQAEREEQQRIKNLVLNYDLGDDNDSNDGDTNTSSTHLSILQKNPNAKGSIKGSDKRPSSHRDQRNDKNARGGFRARKLQLSDVDWYD
ncbi:nonsense-mediated mRNA decay protein 2 [Microsporum canis CBS 113480]|uniref:Nonsense-mediated mRNA decay protein 2 n=1 Tax=Arthroderma otae (strain ATCC MYA-4605 / CBS 113480) TaxID=554155 RepID=C5FPA5_ARTOC|nr:nonsense-mediated mRNA decay protein 2 [Microsporum canis CBS 113480]EEQ31421.1 nonsense-mediated mRNA decay protein 2 [Microsporum canis CBS 113480]